MAAAATGWDLDGNGRLEVNNLLRAFDADGTRTLDRKELLPLLKQVLSQTEFTNALLEQLRNLEEHNLRMGREAKAKQRTLLQTMSVVEVMRAEKDELCEALETERRRTSALELTVESSTLESERSVLRFEEARVDMEEARRLTEEEAARRSSMNREFEGGRAAWRDALETREVELGESRRIAEELRRELATASSTMEELRREARTSHSAAVAARQAIAEAQTELAVSKVRGEEEVREMERALRLSTAAERQNGALVAERDELRSETDRLRASVDASETTQRRSMSRLESTEAELSRRDERIVELSSLLTTLETEKTQLESELGRVGKELVRLAQNASAESEALRKRAHEAEEKRAAQVLEMKLETESHSVQVSKRAAEDIAARRDAELQYVRLQKEHEQLHVRLCSQRDELKSCQSERTRLNQQVESLERETRSAKEAANLAMNKTKEADERRTMTSLAEQASRQEFENKGSSEIAEALEAASLQVNQAQKKAASFADEIALLHSRLETSRSYHAKARQRLDEPLRQWHAETRQAMLALVGKLQESKRRDKDRLIELTEAQAKCAEVKGSAEAAFSAEQRLREEVASLRREHEDDGSATESRVNALRAERDATEARRVDALERSKRAQLALDEANSKIASTEERLRASTLELLEMRRSSTETETLFEQLRTEKESKFAAMSQDAERSRKHVDTLEVQSRDLTLENSRLAESFRRSEEQAQRVQSNLGVVKGVSVEELAIMNANTARLHEQLESTKGLLNVLRQQREDLQTDNAILKQELDTMYSNHEEDDHARETPHNNRNLLRNNHAEDFTPH